MTVAALGNQVGPRRARGDDEERDQAPGERAACRHSDPGSGPGPFSRFAAGTERQSGDAPAAARVQRLGHAGQEHYG